MLFMPEEVLERMLQSFGLQRIPLRPLVKPQGEGKKPARVLEMEPVMHRTDVRPWARVAAAIAVPILGGASMFIADQWDTEAALMSAVPLFPEHVETASFQPRFEEEAVLLSGISSEAVFETSISAVEGLSKVQYDFTKEIVSTQGSTVILEVEESAELRGTSDEIRSSDAGEAKLGIPNKSDRMFALVAGAFAVESNALRMARNLRIEGFSSEIFLQDDGLHVVTYAAFDEEGDARAELEQLRDDERWANAWLKRFEG